MDKKTLPLILICILLILFWGPIMDKIWPQKTLPPSKTNQALNHPTSEQAKTNHSVASPSVEKSILEPLQSVSTPQKAETPILENDQIQVKFTSIGGGIETVTLKKFHEKDEGLIVLNAHSPLPLLAVATGPISFQTPYQLTVESNQLQATYHSNGIEISKKFILASDYQVTSQITVKNTGREAYHGAKFQVVLGMATPMNRHDSGQYIDLSFLSPEKTSHEKLSDLQKHVEKQKKPFEASQSIKWAALKNQYFTLLTTPSVPFASIQAEPYTLPPNPHPDSVKNQQGMVAVMASAPFHLEPGASTNWIFEVYAGPKEYKRLVALGEHQDQILDFGFFEIFSKALLWLMSTFHQFTHNWGIAIILVTVVIKVLFWPLTAMSTRSMKQMQALAPKMNVLKEKYKDNQKKLNEEMMKMYRDYKINPMAGCLPMLVQIPIFFAFYNLLSTAIELRNQPFILWIHNLSAPDTVGHILGFPINPLPLIMAGTMIWQTKITPQAPNADPSMKIMGWLMPAMFLFICYNTSSGLSLYWTVQNLLTILQTYYTKDKPVEPPQKIKSKGGFTFSRPIEPKKKS